MTSFVAIGIHDHTWTHFEKAGVGTIYADRSINKTSKDRVWSPLYNLHRSIDRQDNQGLSLISSIDRILQCSLRRLIDRYEWAWSPLSKIASQSRYVQCCCMYLEHVKNSFRGSRDRGIDRERKREERQILPFAGWFTQSWCWILRESRASPNSTILL
jgi:hypothetical protein